jgi:hypothetical protein
VAGCWVINYVKSDNTRPWQLHIYIYIYICVCARGRSWTLQRIKTIKGSSQLHLTVKRVHFMSWILKIRSAVADLTARYFDSKFWIFFPIQRLKHKYILMHLQFARKVVYISPIAMCQDQYCVLTCFRCSLHLDLRIFLLLNNTASHSQTLEELQLRFFTPMHPILSVGHAVITNFTELNIPQTKTDHELTTKGCYFQF